MQYRSVVRRERPNGFSLAGSVTSLICSAFTETLACRKVFFSAARLGICIFGLARSYPVIFERTVAQHETEFGAKAQSRYVCVGIYLTLMPLASAVVGYGYEFGEHHFLVGTSHDR